MGCPTEGCCAPLGTITVAPAEPARNATNADRGPGSAHRPALRLPGRDPRPGAPRAVPSRTSRGRPGRLARRGPRPTSRLRHRWAAAPLHRASEAQRLEERRPGRTGVCPPHRGVRLRRVPPGLVGLPGGPPRPRIEVGGEGATTSRRTARRARAILPRAGCYRTRLRPRRGCAEGHSRPGARGHGRPGTAALTQARRNATFARMRRAP